ncbi:MAG: tRNA 4-thiouridine(8) synthase ThiI [candidate division WOR-3 bacterium]
MIPSRRSKAVGLFSGGLDSILATKLMTEQGIEVIALHFRVPFPAPPHEFSDERLRQIAESAGASLVSVDVGEDYLDIVKAPTHGYSRGMAPCVDCMLYMLVKARELAQQTRSDFVFTGEVLGQRAHCQNKRSLKLLGREARVEGRLLRPLSAKLLEPTIPELTGIVRRERLLDLKGHGRRRQIRLASEFGILDYPMPTGGCLLIDANFGARVKDAATFDQLKPADRQLLSVGRHFRLESGAKVVVGRNQDENEQLEKLKLADDVVCKPAEVVGPVVLVRGGRKTKRDVEVAARLCARYADAPAGKAVAVACAGRVMKVKALSTEEADLWLIQASKKDKTLEDDATRDERKGEPDPG